MQVDVRSDQAILAVVGEGMKGRPGVAGKVFDSLGRQNINISAIAQGASERNISCVIDASQQVRALNAIHQGFFETRKRLAIAMIGVGNVGGAVLRQLEQQRSYLLSKGFDVTRRRPRQQQAVSSPIATGRSRRRGRISCTRRPSAWMPRVRAAHRRDGDSPTPRWSIARRARRSSTPIRRSSTPTCTSSRRTNGRTRCRGAAIRR